MEKYEKLKEYLRSLGSVAVAFSGGVDSTFLLKTAKDVLGENCVAVTVRSSSFPKREFNEARDFCKTEGIRQIIVEFDEFSIDGFAQNPKNRCYLCKTELFRKMKEAIVELGINNIAEGSNMDDNVDYRPGLTAVSEQGVKSPLRYIEFNKEEIRNLSRKMNLPTSEKPSFACLASRFVYGETITKEKLQMLDKAEQFLLDNGFTQVRVRIHNNLARIEILPDEFPNILKISEKICAYFREIGFSYVSLDLQGYRSGSMNEVLSLY